MPSLQAISPADSIAKAYLKVRPTRSQIDKFQSSLIALLDHANASESEEYHKNLVSAFLSQTYYHPTHYINTRGRNDLVIHLGKDANTPVGVILEAKRPTNSAQMLRLDDINRKATHELLLYYLRERFASPTPNLNIRHLIATNSYEWYIFDANIFEQCFASDKLLVAAFRDFEAGRLSGTTTEFFYNEIARPAIARVYNDLAFSHVDVRAYEAALRNADKGDDKRLVTLYKLLSPQHLLKLPFENDSNNLHRGFYTELLHIIGLSEVRDGNKWLIQRNEVGKRHAGSIMENAILQLDTLDKINRLRDPYKYGENKAERLFGVGIELAISWINRIVFLKLVEAQIVAFHRGDRSLAFLNASNFPDYDSLNGLFFQILAREPSQRSDQVRAQFSHIPYLNSSLFEPTDLEHETIFISNLSNGAKLPVLGSTVLRDAQGQRVTGELPALEYLFRFLDAYDFASDGGGEIQEENKSLISASVLGLIFEKINGYEHGAFFTPGFITMHMSRDIIRRAVLNKFLEVKGWSCATLEQLYDHIEDRAEANKIINSIRVCDPAVGSGHFLVSALNELIAVKAELRILQDQAGQRLKEYQFSVASDELVVTDEDGTFFRYIPTNPESQRVQEALFHEKKTLIEGSLFGVDVNPNSVAICRLRLWIELLKNAYYRSDGTLETLPNIDINIKRGDSLIGRFSLDTEIASILKRRKVKIADYRRAVHQYQNAVDKEEKREMQDFISKLTGDLRTEIFDNDPKVRRLRSVRDELALLKSRASLFPETQEEQLKRDERERRLSKELDRLEAEIQEIQANRIYKDAFEWRFEFPEVLADDGRFEGFDAIVGNPPYGVPIRDVPRKYIVATLGKVPDFEVYYWFINRAFQLLKRGGILGFIVPNSILFNVGAASYRLNLFERWELNEVLDCTEFPVFVDAVVRNAILTFTKGSRGATLGYRPTDNAKSFAQLVTRPRAVLDRATVEANNTNWALLFRLGTDALQLVRKIKSFVPLMTHFDATQGYIPYRLSDLVVAFGREEARRIVTERKWHAETKLSPDYLEELWGRSISKYNFTPTGSFVKYGSHLASYVDLRYFNQRRVLVREITNPGIVASIVDGTYVNDPQIISIVPKSGECSLEWLWAVLNSKMAAFYHASSSPKATKGLFPKILVVDVKTFPLAMPPGGISAEVVQLVQNVIKRKRENIDADTRGDEDRLERYVYQAYGITDGEAELIKRSLAGRHAAGAAEAA